MMLVLFFEHANTVYQIGKRVLTALMGNQGSKDGDHHEDDEDDELINSFSDRDLLPKNKPQSAASSPSASSTPSPSTSGGKMKAAESVKRLESPYRINLLNGVQKVMVGLWDLPSTMFQV
eukprot:CAMPEP_0173133888 /NCGR_PEP_ID=MMETSP1105-20130129/975_1 /TAXON_ID=2985 /ORGANISM="Ochromonas sp., Strain BG-1" /LENGTH=119 /DNA_ID=CAMNT_0014045603 /DNA_START=735 /DNA_END=1095 /DNA_ORIENTATION=+